MAIFNSYVKLPEGTHWPTFNSDVVSLRVIPITTGISCGDLVASGSL